MSTHALFSQGSANDSGGAESAAAAGAVSAGLLHSPSTKCCTGKSSSGSIGNGVSANCVLTASSREDGRRGVEGNSGAGAASGTESISMPSHAVAVAVAVSPSPCTTSPASIQHCS